MYFKSHPYCCPPALQPHIHKRTIRNCNVSIANSKLAREDKRTAQSALYIASFWVASHTSTDRYGNLAGQVGGLVQTLNFYTIWYCKRCKWVTVCDRDRVGCVFLRCRWKTCRCLSVPVCVRVHTRAHRHSRAGILTSRQFTCWVGMPIKPYNLL